MNASIPTSRNPGTQPSSAENSFAVLVLLVSLGAFTNLTVTGAPRSDNTGDIAMQILWSISYLITLFFYFRRCANPVRTIVSVFPLLAVVAVALASVFWSQDPALTARRSIALCLSLVFGIYFATRFSLKQQFRLLAVVFAICIVCSFFFELLGLNPDQGIAGWYGIFYVKVELGRNMALGALAFLFWKRLDPSYGSLALAGFIGSALLVVLSRDVTSLLILTLTLFLIPYFRNTLRSKFAWAVSATIFLFAAGCMSALYVFAHLRDVTSMMGKDPMLTGRVPLWIFSTFMALRRPWLGYGFDAFWLPSQPYTQKIWHLLRWMPPHAHNGLLELWLELGLVGTGLFVLAFVFYLQKAVRLVRLHAQPEAAWPLVFLLFLFLANLTENAFLVTNSIYFFLFTAVALTCSRDLAFHAAKKSCSLAQYV